MKKSELQSLIREEIKKVLTEEATEIPKSVEDANTEMAKLVKLVKKLPADLKSKLVKKIKTAQGDVDSYIGDIQSEKDKK